ncbi:MAG: asparagine synthase-related protein [Candidatus Parvarchaeum sp.]|nr:asparagine synthase C-terminal domain-containing protein [Candidatus Parvarchaeum tengchongense]MCW1295487.1 asparagine synthase C-terminal domain-containing protein [Candidatus Parvarchaeum tengchongense]MCW1299094.1 asparagine synthase C-terminal domain-containing protein [Candidatus Parvarchaeum tengchongense]
MKNRNDTLLINRINSTSKNEKIFDFRFIFPGGAAINLFGNAINVKLRNNEKTEQYDIEQALKDSIIKFKPDSVLVSGGIDSSVLAAIAVKKFKDIKLISAGTEDSEDIDYARILSSELNSSLYNVTITEENLIHAVKELKVLGLDTYNVIMGITEFLAVEKAKEIGMQRIISGIGSDELFFGFQRHRTIKKEELGEFREYRLFYMPALDLWRLNSIADTLNVSIAFPYLDDKVIEAALSKDIKELAENYDKFPVRSIGKSLGLSGKLTERRKKAMQYGSGTVKLLRDLSKKKKYENVGEFIKEI